jgi:DNA-binding NtrC family response regulator
MAKTEVIMAPARILIADDERSIRSLLRLCLEHASYQVTEAATGSEAIDAIVTEPPDLILLDLSMPAIQGMDVLRRLNSMAVRPKPRIIVMTANGSIARAVEAVQLGASDFLEKPWKPEHLLAVIAHVLEQKALAESAVSDNYRTTLALARRHLVDGHGAKAEALLRAASRLAGQDPDYFYLLGLWHEINERPADAKVAYHQAALYDAHHGPAREALLRLSLPSLPTEKDV